MEPATLHRLGKITKTSGYKGNLVFFFEDENLINLLDIQSVFVEMDGNTLPLFIEEISFFSPVKAKVKLADIESEEMAGKFVNRDIYIPVEWIPQIEEDLFKHEIPDFMVIDEEYGKLGNIDQLIDNPMQKIMLIKHKAKEVLIPFSDEIIKKIDKENKTIMIKAPDGLIDLYLNA